MDFIKGHVLVARQHIQNHSEANTHYWAYPSRTLPCTNDPGSCEYLEQVYSGHVRSMLYTFILWGVILATFLLWGIARIMNAGRASHGAAAPFFEIASSLQPLRRHLLPDAPMRWLFGRISRLQVAILAVLTAYLAIFTFVGMTYQIWYTPVKGTNLFNTRSTLGTWSDRIGALAYALTPFAVLLCMRESVLSLVTGIPYQHFNFLHRWLGRIIFAQSALHTIGWTIIEVKLYQPQPTVAEKWIKQQYMIFGCIAMILIFLLTVFSLQPVIRWTGYEFFKITHWIIAVLYIGACWGHWDKLWCWMVPSLALIAIDQAIRAFRTCYIHLGGKPSSASTFLSFKCALANQQVLTDDNGTVLRLDFPYEHRSLGGWEPGQHFYLTFPSLSIWQAHPYTVSSLPDARRRVQHHTYLLRVRNGQTKQLAELGHGAKIPVILSGPYGKAFPSYEAQHVLAVAGGTGVTFTWPIVMEALKQSVFVHAVVEFVWVVRKAEDLLWLGRELGSLKKGLAEKRGLRIAIYVTRDISTSISSSLSGRPPSSPSNPSTSSNSHSTSSLNDLLSSTDARFRVHWLKDHHPDVDDIVTDFVDRVKEIRGGALEILGSGPEAMGSDLRSAVAKAARREKEKVGFYWDSRG
ncbi:hypothetical protein CERZMDRAFT_67873 [Cercospora zeae-maydis SCOH1-5]|uniref:ferric-chelate reductase (NADPH) n=1 Tax=Cercospora zeae-maydis SCOH1-5 TaxID=717836 RepID=A0A6A6FG34_9PEZI|nr:hypothetical protein CERZMDRAFT_67873 [Cercospora zeae-maydis SCOH1-5]